MRVPKPPQAALRRCGRARPRSPREGSSSPRPGSSTSCAASDSARPRSPAGTPRLIFHPASGRSRPEGSGPAFQHEVAQMLEWVLTLRGGRRGRRAAARLKRSPSSARTMQTAAARPTPSRISPIRSPRTAPPRAAEQVAAQQRSAIGCSSDVDQRPRSPVSSSPCLRVPLDELAAAGHQRDERQRPEIGEQQQDAVLVAELDAAFRLPRRPYTLARRRSVKAAFAPLASGLVETRSRCTMRPPPSLRCSASTARSRRYHARRHPALPHGRLLRDVLRGRGATPAACSSSRSPRAARAPTNVAPMCGVPYHRSRATSAQARAQRASSRDLRAGGGPAQGPGARQARGRRASSRRARARRPDCSSQAPTTVAWPPCRRPAAPGRGAPRRLDRRVPRLAGAGPGRDAWRALGRARSRAFAPREIVRARGPRLARGCAASAAAEAVADRARRPRLRARARQADLRRHFGVASLDGFGLMRRAAAARRAAGAALRYAEGHAEVRTRSPRRSPARSHEPRGSCCSTSHAPQPGDRAHRCGTAAREGSLLGALDATATAPGGAAPRAGSGAPVDRRRSRARHDAVEELPERVWPRGASCARQLRGGRRPRAAAGRAVARHRERARPASACARRSRGCRRVARARGDASRAARARHGDGARSAARSSPRALARRSSTTRRPTLAEGGRHPRRLRRRARRAARPPARRQGLHRRARGARARAHRDRARSRSATTRSSATTSRSRKRTSTSCPSDYSRKQTIAGGERYVTPELKELRGEGPHAPRSASRRSSCELFEALRAEVAAQAARLQRRWRARSRSSTRCAPSRGRAAGSGLRAAAVMRRAARLRSSAGATRSWSGRSPSAPSCPTTSRSTPTAQRSSILPAPTWPARAPTAAGGADRAAWRRPARSCRPTRRDDRPRRPHLHAASAPRTTSRAGQSTFMVEMTETANILHHATAQQPGDPRRDRPRHLHLRRPLDRLGGRRAPARPQGGAPRTLFATHYHELTELAASSPAC